jgi:hypothetical protein
MSKIVKIIIVLDLLIINVAILNAQKITWQKEYPKLFDVEGSTVTETFDKCFLMSGQTKYQPGKFLVLKVNTYGDTVWSRLLVGEYCSSILQLKDSNILITGGIDGQPIAYKISNNGSILWEKTYLTEYSSGLIWSLELENNNLVLFGNILKPGKSITFAIRTNSSGDSISTKYLDITNGTGNISYFNEKQLLLSGSRLSPSVAVLTDFEGDLIKNSGQFFYLGTANSVTSHFYFIKDTVLNSFRAIIVTKTDSNFNIKLRRTVYFPFNNLHSFDIIETGSGILICGYVTNGLNDNPNSFLLNLNSEIEVNWYREYKILNRYHYFENVIRSSDDGFLAVGSIGIEGDQVLSNLFGTKTDSTGFANPLNCIISTEQILLTNYLYQNYPNPFNSETIIRVFLNANSSVRVNIYSLTGQNIYEHYYEKLLKGNYEMKFKPSSGISTGIYFYTFEIFDGIKTQILTRKFVLIK